ncbi:Vegetative incompatibility protein HET-E-1 [Penicillium chrysogenum]|uniref:Vegetative incompatibility protein HET-E-1 n=1 Tax=Penicillium chrysogenum TaxID=5076 RepID=A0ABQ8WT99_PENCH|nr:Vegetative incompatibility protein HET-E-1 [Penicillium chrysogenum]
MLGVSLNIKFSAGGSQSNINSQDQDRQSKDRCLDYFAVTDPRDVMTDIYQTRGAALKECYEWILTHTQFQCWLDGNECQVLWVKGDPGKGKTMLLCGIIDELSPATKLADPQAKTLLSFFFCQATAPQLSNAGAVLRGLIYMLVKNQPSLLSYVQERFKDTGEPRFGDTEAWAALCNMFVDILHHSSPDKIYIVIDALDECVQDQDKLLQFVLKQTKGLPRVKWIISSRNHIMQRTRLDDSQSILSLELQENAESVSLATRAYIANKIAELDSLQDDNTLLEHVQHTLQTKAEGTFLWVALVVQEIQHVDSWRVRQVVNDVPRGLDDLYARMIDQIERMPSDEIRYCRLILSAAALAYRPLQLLELGVVSRLPDEIARKAKNIVSMIKRSGSFLTVRDDTIYFVHQSAKDYLIGQGGQSIFLSDHAAAHRRMFTQSLAILERTLRRDVYSLGALGTPVPQAPPPESDPLEVARYSCVYWVDHLERCGTCEDFQDAGPVDAFLRKRCLYWFEALSLLRNVTTGIMSIQKLVSLVQGSKNLRLLDLVRDAHRFFLYHRKAIEESPLQVYVSALVFSPGKSILKGLFSHEGPEWISAKHTLEDHWSACLQTIESHSNSVWSVTFSHDSSLLASGSSDTTVNIWNTGGKCLQTLRGHSDIVNSVGFSHDSKLLASASADKTVIIWDVNGKSLQALRGHCDMVRSVTFSHDSKLIASASNDQTIIIWDTSGKCVRTLRAHSDTVRFVTFSHDSKHLASASNDQTVIIWDTNGRCLQRLQGHSSSVLSVTFSHDSKLLASASSDQTIFIWNANGEHLRTLRGHSSSVWSVAFSHDSTLLASGSSDRTVILWDTQSGQYLQVFRGHSDTVRSVAFSHDSTRLASASQDRTVRIWEISDRQWSRTPQSHNHSIRSVSFSHDLKRLATASLDKSVKIWNTARGERLQTLEGHSDWVWSAIFSSNSKILASASHDQTVKIWDTASGKCLRTLQGHTNWVCSVVFSADSNLLASASGDSTVKIWDTHSGKCLYTLQRHQKAVRAVTFSRDSQLVASGSDDQSITLWNARRGICLRTFQGHKKWVHSVAFSNDAKLLVSGSYDKTIKIWDSASGKCVQSFNIGTIFSTVSFDKTSSHLCTDLGLVPISSPLDMAEGGSTTRELRMQGLGVSYDRRWITWNLENLLWLPSEYRPSCSTVEVSTISIGCDSGLMLIFDFELDRLFQYVANK